MLRVAIIGAGISGLGAALSLTGRPGIEVMLFEKEPRAGGHAHTITVNHEGRRVAVDTGFIVYNELNYPNLTAMFRWAGVDTLDSDMSFALSSGDGALEWAGRQTATLSGLFAQRRNLFDPGFLSFLLGIRQFQKVAIEDVLANRIGSETLEAYLTSRSVPHRVRDDYVVPMGAAIWSMTPGETLAFPARAFMSFFNNHKLLQWDRPRWRTVKGGSRTYVSALEQRLAGVLRKQTAIARIERAPGGVRLTDTTGAQTFANVAILATHAPTARRLIADATPDEAQVLSAFKVSRNQVVVHRDPALMPRRRAAWAAWNLMRKDAQSGAAVTYWMNLLQSLPEDFPLFVTLNPDRAIDPDKVFARFEYDHPLYDAPALAAQERLALIQGRNRIHFAGAWTGHGFHEDGLASGLAAAHAIGGIAPWLR